MESQSPLLSAEMLTELEHQWSLQGAPLLEHLRTGLSGQEMDALVAPLDLRLPLEARIWWGWHDGATTNGRPSVRRTVGAGLEYLPLAEAVEQYRACREASQEVAGTAGQPRPLSEPEYWWAPQWFPISLTGYGGVVACDCSVGNARPTPIRMIWWAGRESFAEPVTQSFGQMVSWWIDALKTGVWRYEAGRDAWQVNHDLLDDPTRELTRLV
jgi:cell wall assembly regulator SMI1